MNEQISAYTLSILTVTMEAEGWREGEGSPRLIWAVPQDFLPFTASSDSTSWGPSLGLNIPG